MNSQRRQRGFTLIELMIAMLISTLLVSMILAIFMRTSLAYRSQQQVASVQQVLTSARAMFEFDAKMAGLQMSQGVKVASDSLKHSPVEITNSSSAPDEIAFFYGDPSVQALVTNGVTPTTVAVDSSAGFAANDLVLLSTADVTTTSNPISPTTDAKLAIFDACVLKIASLTSTSITFVTTAPWGNSTNSHCSATTANKTMVYKFVAHAYRIDQTTARKPDGVLQMSATGDLAPSLNDWQDYAFGFTDIQVATRFFDQNGVDTTDPDTDGDRDWYSSTSQGTMTAPIAYAAAFTPPIELTISLVARSDRDVEGVSTAATPTLTVSGNTANNMIGDRASITLPSGSDTALQGNRVYRYTTFQIDLRNIGVGR